MNDLMKPLTNALLAGMLAPLLGLPAVNVALNAFVSSIGGDAIDRLLPPDTLGRFSMAFYSAGTSTIINRFASPSERVGDMTTIALLIAGSDILSDMIFDNKTEERKNKRRTRFNASGFFESNDTFRAKQFQVAKSGIVTKFSREPVFNRGRKQTQNIFGPSGAGTFSPTIPSVGRLPFKLGFRFPQ